MLSIEWMLLLLQSSFSIDVRFTGKVHALLMLLMTEPRTVWLIRGNNGKNIDKTHTFSKKNGAKKRLNLAAAAARKEKFLLAGARFTGFAVLQMLQ